MTKKKKKRAVLGEGLTAKGEIEFSVVLAISLAVVAATQ